MIEFQKVTKRFRRVDVLKGIDLNIDRGDRVALVGSNGAGKTTMIRCLLGEYQCGGKVIVDGLEPRKHRTEVLRQVGFVPQISPPLKMPVGQLIRFAAGVCDSDPQKMVEVAEKLGLDINRMRHQPFNKLSGGQKQKLLISIALGRDCELLVLDEPAANLDPEARHIFFQLLEEKRDKAAMIISSHRLDEVASLVNRVVEMDQGQIVLNDHVADDVDLTRMLSCRLVLTRASEAFARTIEEWQFTDVREGIIWEGRVAGPDRLRFLGMLSRYAAILKAIHLDEAAD
ncbi:ABC transporter ATP-binding protein [Thiolapillus brandeum]|uniref:ABC-2 type transporter ATP-binding protein n=1 Tax=Thiolapillus brandeum TaxID=1076588 RepID=A0A7U6GH55_9GAMM|nr:ABC transporter ATP-binding protein [Thiolapillus brandeum]BAO43565.1 ABC-2 type transporter ATP-binding protein [Thiolapillus brandeum]